MDALWHFGVFPSSICMIQREGTVDEIAAWVVWWQRLTQSFDLPRASRASNSSPPVTLVVKMVATSCDLGMTVWPSPTAIYLQTPATFKPKMVTWQRLSALVQVNHLIPWVKCEAAANSVRKYTYRAPWAMDLFSGGRTCQKSAQLRKALLNDRTNLMMKGWSWLFKPKIC